METKASFRLATEQDTHLETYDHTKLSAINTCPTWGVLRYSMHKKMSTDGRALALECGHAMHECFAFVRLVSLCEQHKDRHKFQEKLWYYHGTRLFGQARLEEIDRVIQQADDIAEVAKRGCIAVLDTSGYYDDPRDRRRTLSNMEECIYAYINRWRWDHRVWIRDTTDPTSDVGIEIPFDLVVGITGDSGDVSFRLTGRIDGIHWNGRGDLAIHDNKTASRLSDAWSQSFLLSHQVTGYCVAASTFTQHAVHNAEVLGLAIPLPKTYDFGGYIRETVSRRDYHYTRWIDWLVHTINMARQYDGNPYDAPKYTHSCNRYFRPCSFIPFCDADPEEQHTIVNEMVTDEWSPLEGKTMLDGVGNE